MSKKEKTNLYKIAYDYIKEIIILGEKKDGDIIKEKDVCEALNISRTPVRRAITKLESENYLKCIEGLGTIVVGLSLRDLRDIYEVRSALERIALSSSIENINEKDILKMEDMFNKILDEYVKTKKINFNEISEADAYFHQTIISNCNNNYVKETIKTLKNKIQRYQYDAYVLTDTLKESTKQHLKILKSIKEKNLKLATKQLDNHIKWSFNIMVNYLTHL